jgi:NADPH:quinone reductase-like Zn-dependent oxidoreductase
MRLAGKRGVDLVFEHVGGDVFEKSIRSLTRGGRLVTCGGTASYDVAFNVAYIFHKQLSIIGSNSATKRELEEMMPLLAERKLQPVVDRVFPLPEAAAAHHYMADRRNFGKVVLVPEH